VAGQDDAARRVDLDRRRDLGASVGKGQVEPADAREQ
jgi:hypothetical protein